MSSDQRRHPRVPSDVPVVLKSGEGEHGGRLRDVSVGGAAVEFAPELGKSDVSFDIGEAVAMQPDGGGSVSGTVVRSEPDRIAMKFDRPQEALMTRIVASTDESGD